LYYNAESEFHAWQDPSVPSTDAAVLALGILSEHHKCDEIKMRHALNRAEGCHESKGAMCPATL